MSIVTHAGDGKSHYILNNLQYNCSSRGVVTIPINEGFSCQRVVDRLRSLPLDADKSEIEVYGVFFNFTMCYPKVRYKYSIKIFSVNNFTRLGHAACATYVMIIVTETFECLNINLRTKFWFSLCNRMH